MWSIRSSSKRTDASSHTSSSSSQDDGVSVTAHYDGRSGQSRRSQGPDELLARGTAEAGGEPYSPPRQSGLMTRLKNSAKEKLLSNQNSAKHAAGTSEAVIPSATHEEPHPVEFSQSLTRKSRHTVEAQRHPTQPKLQASTSRTPKGKSKLEHTPSSSAERSHPSTSRTSPPHTDASQYITRQGPETRATLQTLRSKRNAVHDYENEATSSRGKGAEVVGPWSLTEENLMRIHQEAQEAYGARYAGAHSHTKQASKHAAPAGKPVSTSRPKPPSQSLGSKLAATFRPKKQSVIGLVGANIPTPKEPEDHTPKKRNSLITRLIKPKPSARATERKAPLHISAPELEFSSISGFQSLREKHNLSANPTLSGIEIESSSSSFSFSNLPPLRAENNLPASSVLSDIKQVGTDLWRDQLWEDMNTVETQSQRERASMFGQLRQQEDTAHATSSSTAGRASPPSGRSQHAQSLSSESFNSQTSLTHFTIQQIVDQEDAEARWSMTHRSEQADVSASTANEESSRPGSPPRLPSISFAPLPETLLQTAEPLQFDGSSTSTSEASVSANPADTEAEPTAPSMQQPPHQQLDITASIKSTDLSVLDANVSATPLEPERTEPQGVLWHELVAALEAQSTAKDEASSPSTGSSETNSFSFTPLPVASNVSAEDSVIPAASATSPKIPGSRVPKTLPDIFGQAPKGLTGPHRPLKWESRHSSAETPADTSLNRPATSHATHETASTSLPPTGEIQVEGPPPMGEPSVPPSTSQSEPAAGSPIHVALEDAQNNAPGSRTRREVVRQTAEEIAKQVYLPEISAAVSNASITRTLGSIAGKVLSPLNVAAQAGSTLRQAGSNWWNRAPVSSKPLQALLSGNLSQPDAQLSAHDEAVEYGKRSAELLDAVLPLLHSTLKIGVAGTTMAFGVGRNTGQAAGNAIGRAEQGIDQSGGVTAGPQKAAAAMASGKAFSAMGEGVMQWGLGAMGGAIGNITGQYLAAPLVNLIPRQFEPIDHRAVLPNQIVELMNELQDGAGDALRMRVQQAQRDAAKIDSVNNVRLGQIAFDALTGVRSAVQGVRPLGVAGQVGIGLAVSASAGMAIGAVMATCQSAAKLKIPKLDELITAVTEHGNADEAARATALAALDQTADEVPLFFAKHAVAKPPASRQSPADVETGQLLPMTNANQEQRGRLAAIADTVRWSAKQLARPAVAVGQTWAQSLGNSPLIEPPSPDADPASKAQMASRVFSTVSNVAASATNRTFQMAKSTMLTSTMATASTMLGNAISGPAGHAVVAIGNAIGIHAAIKPWFDALAGSIPQGDAAIRAHRQQVTHMHAKTQ